MGQPGMRCPAFLNAEDEVPGFLFGLATAPWLRVAGDAHHLPRSGEEAGVEVEPGDAQLAVFNATVVGFRVRDPDGGKRI